MATITEDYVSFEIAKLLKEKGFDGDTASCYILEDSTHHIMSDKVAQSEYYESQDSNEHGHLIQAPTLQMAMKWLREVYGLHISLDPCYDYDSMHVVFLAFVQNVADVHEFMDGRKNVASYPNAEKSYELAIKYCLENLI